MNCLRGQRAINALAAESGVCLRDRIHYISDVIQQVGVMMLGTFPAAFMKSINNFCPRIKLIFPFADGYTVPAKKAFSKTLATSSN